MAVGLLTLRPYGKQSFSVGLSEYDRRREGVEQIITQTPNVFIFSNLSYEFTLSSELANSAQEVKVYINDVYEPSVYHDGRILFPYKSTSDKRIFIDCYGFVEISLVIQDSQGTNYQLYTEYLPVLVQRGELNDAVKSMVSFVYSHQDFLLLNGEPRAKKATNLKEDGYKNLSEQIMLAEEIATTYESSYGYFKANSRFKIERVTKIDRFEHLQYVAPATVQYTATHLNELRRINSVSGIRIGKQTYQPEKTLLLQNEKSYDIYENQVILGFLRKMIDTISELSERCCALLNRVPQNEEYSAEYVFSSYFMYMETRKSVESWKLRLKKLGERFVYLWTMYSDIFRFQPDSMQSEPRPTHILLSVPQYNHIFTQIYKWFRFGVYDFSAEKFMFSFIKVSSLYEGYLLVKMIAYFQARGYTLIDSKKRTYPMEYGSKYENTNCINTFWFKNERHKLTLYYQPVIYDTDKSDINGIHLIRNNSIAVSAGENDCNVGASYYSPDYIIKVEDESSTQYLILDAKFSDYNCVRKYHVKNLAFKYLFSLSPIRSIDTISGLCLIYGKCSASETIQSAYDKRLPGQKIAPLSELLPMMESISNEDHFHRLDVLMRSAFPGNIEKR